MLPIGYDTLHDYGPAFAGMLADIGFTDKFTLACGAAGVKFGTVVGEVAATGKTVLPVGANPAGVAIHDHTLAGRRAAQDGYVEKDAVSVLRRGRIWGLASGASTKEAVAKYDPATGIFADSGTATLANAKFKSGAISIPGLLPGEPAMLIVLVELHDPTVA